MQNDRPTHHHGVGLFGWAIFALVALVVIGIFVTPFLWGYYGMMPAAATTHYPFPFFGWFLFPFGFLIFLFVIFFAVRWLVFPWRGYYRGGRGNWGNWGSPEEILRRRYARGDITKDQFDQMMRDLEQHR